MYFSCHCIVIAHDSPVRTILYCVQVYHRLIFTYVTVIKYVPHDPAATRGLPRSLYINQTNNHLSFQLTSQNLFNNKTCINLRKNMSSAKQFGTMKRSSVAQTCNQLSMFLKEKSCLKDLINAKIDDTGTYFSLVV